MRAVALSLLALLLWSGSPQAQDSADLDALQRQARDLYAAGRLTEAEATARRAIELAERRNGPAHPSVAIGLNNLAATYYALGRPLEAEAMFKRSLAIAEAALGSDHLEVATALNNLAAVSQSRGLPAEAEPLLDRALGIRERQLGLAHPLTIQTVGNLAAVLQVQGYLAEAEPLQRRALAAMTAAQGAGHPETLVVQNNLGVLLTDQGRLDEARSVLEQTLAARRIALGPDHPDVGQSLYNLARVQTAAGRLDEAEALLRQAVDVQQRVLGPTHPQVALSLAQSATIAATRGRLDEARVLWERASATPGWSVADIPILFATSRKPEAGLYGNGQETDVARLSLGVATVRAPHSEVANRAARAAEGLGQLHRMDAGRLTRETALGLFAVEPKTADAIASHVRQQLPRAARFQRQAFVYVHGVNNTFDEAVRRTAMIAYDLDFDGVAAVFAWPARSGPLGYLGDRERARTATPFLIAMLDRLTTAMPDGTIHLIAHSTGSEIVLDTLERLAERAAPTPTLGEIVLAHADVDQLRFDQAMTAVRKLGRPITLYATGRDWAVWLSNQIRGEGGRVGARPTFGAGIESIDVSALGERLDLNHNVFVRHPVVFADMARLMATGERPPDKRSKGFEPVRTAEGVYWRFIKPR